MILKEKLEEALTYATGMSKKIKVLEEWIEYLKAEGFIQFPSYLQLSTGVNGKEGRIRVYFTKNTEGMGNDNYYLPNYVVKVDYRGLCEEVIFFSEVDGDITFSHTFKLENSTDQNLRYDLDTVMNWTIVSIRNY